MSLLSLSLRALVAAFLFAGGSFASAGIITFQDLTLTPGTHWNDPGNTAPVGPASGPYGNDEYIGDFSSGGATFVNRVDTTYGSWRGFAYSNELNASTSGSLPGLQHEFSAYVPPGDPANIFGVAFSTQTFPVNPLAAITTDTLKFLPSMTVPTAMAVTGAYLTNTTYSALSMLNGDTFAKQFGGATGLDPDFLLVRAYGVDVDGNVLAARPEFYLADFRFADSASDYILDSWEWFDLTSLAGASEIYFDFESSDMGTFGANTPLYFAIDDIGFEPAAVPEPSSALMAITAAGVFWRFRRRKSAAARESTSA
ncbi:hypothetical protein Pan44_50220 [Caulifigura coniformis]|uniref:Uncharacterized protein n=1 Tax=Caulifigura coniformis TaxID=2527983 RepID=A0A517SLF3_9PLAN|nr:DUF4465 domain-containing protein [Caulifigura coniformis]QDT56959.1 hypothetical protein Pan44_50220 [Caulifigura coniformis]